MHNDYRLQAFKNDWFFFIHSVACTARDLEHTHLAHRSLQCTQSLGGHMTLATPPFKKILMVMSRLSSETCLSNVETTTLGISIMLFMFTGLTNQCAVKTDTDRHTSNKNIISVVYSIHSSPYLGPLMPVRSLPSWHTVASFYRHQSSSGAICQAINHR